MIRLSHFDIVMPTSIADATAHLSNSNGETKILAGGTDLIVGMKQGLLRPKRVIWLGKIEELQQITFSQKEGLRIGAMCTLNEIEQNEHVQQYFPSLVQAIRSIASPQIRNKATIGGNLCLNTRCFYYDQSEFWRGALGYCLKYGNSICHAAPELSRCSAVFCSDLAPLLIAFGASVKVAGPNGERNIPLSDLYCDDGANHLTLRRGEVLVEVIIPFQSTNVRTTFQKLRMRGSIDFPLVNVATTATLDTHGVIRAIRIIVGAIHSMPIELRPVEDILLHKRLTLDQIDHATEEAFQCVKPLPNLIESVPYRKLMVRHVVKKTLIDLMASTSALVERK